MQLTLEPMTGRLVLPGNPHNAAMWPWTPKKEQSVRFTILRLSGGLLQYGEKSAVLLFVFAFSHPFHSAVTSLLPLFHKLVCTTNLVPGESGLPGR